MNRKMSNLVLFIIQCILLVICLILGVMYIIGNKGVIDIMEIIVGFDLIVIGINSYVVYRNIKISLINIIVGVIILTAVLLNKVGVL